MKQILNYHKLCCMVKPVKFTNTNVCEKWQIKVSNDTNLNIPGIRYESWRAPRILYGILYKIYNHQRILSRILEEAHKRLE